MDLLRKNQILVGKKQTVACEVGSLGGILMIRPLSGSEYSEIESIVKSGGFSGIKTKPVLDDKGDFDKNRTISNLEIEINPGEVDKLDFDARCQTVVYALDNSGNKDDYSLEDVKEFPPGSVEEISKAVFVLSGVDDPTKSKVDMELFRKEK